MTATKINVLPFFSRAEQLPFKIPVHVPVCVCVSGSDLFLFWGLTDGPHLQSVQAEVLLG